MTTSSVLRRRYAPRIRRQRLVPASAREDADAIIINPAGFSFTSAGIMHAIKAFEGPVREVHISNIHATGGCQRHSKPSPTGAI